MSTSPAPSLQHDPLISLVLPVKNAMPHLQDMVEALRRQSYRNFELIIQDGGSTDGTLNYLHSIRDLPKIDIVSEPDSGIGQAYNRGMARAKGDLICLIAADEWLDDNALEKGVAWFRQNPDAAVIYCGIRLVDASRRVLQVFIPPAFDLTRFLRNEIFPTPNAAFLNRQRIGPDLYYDESLATCPDYDFWIRLGSRFNADQLVVAPEPITSARADRTSMSYRVECFDQFVRDKQFILDRYLLSLPDQSKADALRASAAAGILLWAAESVFAIAGPSPEFLKWCGKAARLNPQSPRLAKLARRSGAFEVDASGRLILNPSPQPASPTGETVPVEGLVSLDELYSHTSWKPAEVESGIPVRIVTGPGPWHYSAVIPLTPNDGIDAGQWYWAKLNVRVASGQVAIGLLAPDDIFSERLIAPEDGRVDVFVRLNQPDATGVMIRNGSLGGPSTVEIFSATAEGSVKPL